jgi:hypothetical protein
MPAAFTRMVGAKFCGRFLYYAGHVLFAGDAAEQLRRPGQCGAGFLEVLGAAGHKGDARAGFSKGAAIFEAETSRASGDEGSFSGSN